MYSVIGFLSVFLPFLLFLIIRGRILKREQDELIRQKREDQKDDRDRARAYRKLCRKNGWTVPLSTDDFYSEYPDADPSHPIESAPR